ncbi:hypothetical protein DSECCO2_647680 [anaerobic digester metagenome]
MFAECGNAVVEKFFINCFGTQVNKEVEARNRGCEQASVIREDVSATSLDINKFHGKVLCFLAQLFPFDELNLNQLVHDGDGKNPRQGIYQKCPAENGFIYCCVFFTHLPSFEQIFFPEGCAMEICFQVSVSRSVC